jgi:hypothetical protein
MRREPNLPREAGRELLQTHLPVNSPRRRGVFFFEGEALAFWGEALAGHAFE